MDRFGQFRECRRILSESEIVFISFLFRILTRFKTDRAILLNYVSYIGHIDVESPACDPEPHLLEVEALALPQPPEFAGVPHASGVAELTVSGALDRIRLGVGVVLSF